MNEGQMIVLFGAPAVGKDTVSVLLSIRDETYEHFKKLKRGSGSKHGYIMVSREELDTMRKEGRIVSEVDRYGSTYAVERHQLERSIGAGHTVLIHSAEPTETMTLVLLGAKLVLLECSRASALKRLRERDESTVDQRMEVWDLVTSQLESLEPFSALRLDTDLMHAEKVADAIVAAVASWKSE